MTTDNKLNFTDTNAITYNTDELGFTILGGVRIDGLDRMRVTIKIEVRDRRFTDYLNHPELANLSIRHNLDLYNDVQVDKLIRKVASRLEVGASSLIKAFHEITAQLERYRLEELKKQEAATSIIKKKTLSEKEKQEAITFLKQKKLLQKTNELIGKAGVIGEEHNRLLMYLIFTSRKREQPLHVISMGSSGTGKSHLQEKVGNLIPDEDKIEITTLTENAFYYFGQTELKHKLILIEDLDGADGVLYPIRELQSKRHIIKTVTIKDDKGVTKTVHLKVEGPVTVAGCTTKESVYEDNANRSFLLYIDESKEQDEKIMQYQRKLSAGRVNTDEERAAITILQNTQRILEPITVRNPFAEQLTIPIEVFKPRRTNAHYLQFIEMITFYHQYQREQQVDTETGEVYIETTFDDIKEANSLIAEVLLRKSDDLPGATRNYLEKVKRYLKEQKQTIYTNREIRKALRISATTQLRYQTELLMSGYITRSLQSGKKQTHVYEIVSYEEYKQLQKNVVSLLDQVYEHIRTTAPQPHHKKSGAVNPKKIRRLQAV